MVYEAKPTDALVGLKCGRWRNLAVCRYHESDQLFDIRVPPCLQDGRVEQVPLPSDGIKSNGGYPVVAGPKAVSVELTRDAEVAGKHYAANTFLSYATDPSVPAGQRVSAVYVPSADDFLDMPGGAATTLDQVAFVVNRRLVPKVMVATLANGGWSVREPVQVSPGQSVTALARDDLDNDLIVTTSGFVTPSRQVRDQPGASPHLLAQDPVLFEDSDYTTEIRSATSKDGSRVD